MIYQNCIVRMYLSRYQKSVFRFHILPALFVFVDYNIIVIFWVYNN